MKSDLFYRVFYLMTFVRNTIRNTAELSGQFLLEADQGFWQLQANCLAASGLAKVLKTLNTMKILVICRAFVPRSSGG